MHNKLFASLAPPNRVPGGLSVASVAPHRANHGGSAWSLPSRHPTEKQPQDGSLAGPARIAEMPSRSNGGKLDCESEDARITGGTRSLTRRVLGLNVTDAGGKTPATRKLTPLPSRVA